MKSNHKYSLIIFSSFFLIMLLIFSCKKKDEITGIVARESYANQSGKNLQIIRYMKDQPEKLFSIKNGDTLIVESPLDKGTDSTGSIFRADSAKVIFADGKSYVVVDTTTIVPNFLKSKRTISPSGKIHYYRYTFSELSYEAAQ